MKSIQMEKIYGGILGLCLGDAVGVPVEFMTRQQLKVNPVVGMREFGTHHQPKGTWSDDSSLTFCLMEAMIQSDFNHLDLEVIAELFSEWFFEGYWTPNGDAFDIGRTTAMAIQRYNQGKTVPELCGGNEEADNGNGSLMRVLPLAFWLHNIPVTKAIEWIHQVSSITHRHPRAHIACSLYVFMAMGLIQGRTPKAALIWATGIVSDFYKQNPVYKQELSHYKRIMDQEVIRLSEYEIWSSGYVVDSLEAAIWCLFTTNSYRTCVLAAVNLGEDSDTVAAIAGGLAGLYYPADTIPKLWLSHLKRRGDIENLCKRFYEKLQTFEQ